MRDDDTLLGEAAANLLEWFLAAGVDAFVGETARDRFAETRAEERRRAGAAGVAPPPAPEPGPAAPADDPPPLAPPAAEPFAAALGAAPAMPAERGLARPALLPPEGAEAAAQARIEAARARDLAELEAALRGFEGSPLRLSARSCVFGDGPARARLMLVGEAPGREEDAAGRPFVGRSGQLLDRMLAAIGIARESVRVTNTVPWRPPGNRTPTPAETEVFLPFLRRQIALVEPSLLVCLGNPATKALFETEEGILRLRGRWRDLAVEDAEGRPRTIPATAMLHPAYLLRQPAQKKLAWRDLLALKDRLAGLAGAD